MYQNGLEQSQKHVCDGAYDHYNYMKTRLYMETGLYGSVACDSVNAAVCILWEHLVFLMIVKYSALES